ncbi:MAG: acyltransferase family protein [Selenomonadaceae bacterium]
MTQPDKNTQRLYFFDNLRAGIILLMVIFHIAMGFTTWDLQWWYVNDTQKNFFFDLFVLETDVYIMPIMFLIAGYFAPMILLKKGAVKFWKNKLVRIMLPWGIGVVFFAPLLAYSPLVTHIGAPPAPEYFDFWLNGFWGPFYQQSHYWFLGILTLFFFLLTIVYLIRPASLAKAARPTSPSAGFLLGFTLLTAVSFFAVNLTYWCDTWMPIGYLFCIQPVRLILHLCYFFLGVHAWKQGWFTDNGYMPRLLPWSVSAAIMLVVFLVYRVSFTMVPDVPVLFKAGHALTHCLLAVTSTFALIALFKRFFDSDAYLWRRLAANSYTIYFIHSFIFLPMAYSLQKINMNIALKYVLISIFSLIGCFLVAEYIIGPVIGLLFGKKKKKSLPETADLQ